MRKIQNKVIVWSIDDFNTMGLMRELGQEDLDLLFLIKGKAGIAAKSKYCKEYAETDSVEAGFEYLKSHFHDCEEKPIVIIASDEIVTYVDLHRDELNGRFILPVTAKKGDTAKYIDKNTMTALAREIGILCPESVMVRSDSDIGNAAYPCLIKPSHQKPGHYNEFKFRVCKNAAQLKRTLSHVRKDSEFILQQYIPKEYDLLVYGGRMYDGKTVIAGTMVRDRLSEGGSSAHGSLIPGTPDCVDGELIRKFLEIIDYKGLFSFEYGMVGDRAYFFEVNLRNDGTSHDFFQAGANIPLAYVYSCAALDYSGIPTAVKEKCWFVDDVFDIENVLTGKITRATWKKDKEEATVFRFYDENDPGPWKEVLKTRNRQIFQDIVLSKFRIYIVYVLDKLGLRK